ncbi:hypothetical protein MRB53_008708 [Persea americana]|uniref:Uncharacterized protein n=1 Tax=Persea americana TaxID=3435 RepID=A0ACC2MML6_PERAE|nr:hypothetical protein MRB53_008708 [Persea americana]
MALGFASSLQLLPFPSISHLNVLPFLRRLFSFVFLKDLSLSFYFLYCGLTPCIIDLDDRQTSIHFYVPTRRRFRKPALVLVHGFGGNARWQWQHQVQALSSAFDLFVPDLIYFGGSSSTSAERSVEFQARCIGEGLRRLGVERYSACGISYGGFVVYQMAEAYREEIETVVIMSSGICATEEQREEMLRREGRDVVEILMPESAEDLRVLVERSMYRPPSWMPGFLLQDFIHVMYTDHRKERIEMLKELLEKKVEANPLHVLNQETLIIWGDQDNVFPLYMGYQLKRHLGEKSKLEIIKDAGHAAQMESPRLVNDLIKSFICDLWQ